MAKKRVDTIMDKAKDAFSNNEKVKNLLSEVKGNIDKLNNDFEERSSFIYQVQIIIRMVRAHYQGVYHAFSGSTIFTLVFALVYFITPVDLIPDFIPALGFTDDISLVYMIIRSLADDISKFKAWEESQ